jgi:cytochrome c
MRRSVRASVFAAGVVAAALASFGGAAWAAGDPAEGAKAFQLCAACHSLRPDANMTGPSLAGVWGRKAGGLASFERYSPALRGSDIKWDAATLDAWLTNPAGFIPNNRMLVDGVDDAKTRADLIALLQIAGEGGKEALARLGVNTAPERDLKTLGPDHQVTAIRYCHDTFHVTTGDGQVLDFWERNLRFQADSSGRGPKPGAPVIMPAGMMGDRASVIFAAPEEFNGFIRHQCQ